MSLKSEFMLGVALFLRVFDHDLPYGLGTGGSGQFLPVADLLTPLLPEGGELADGPVGAVGHGSD